MKKKNKPLIIVLSGPSGAGKSTIKDHYMDEYSDSTYFSVSATTRAPRGTEQNGVEYIFVSHEEFEKLVEEGDFVEHKFVHGEYYGTPKSKITEQLALGKDVILDVDVQGAKEVKKQFPDAVMIFVMTPTIEDLEKRLLERGTDSIEKIRGRVKDAEEEVKQADFFENKIITVEKERSYAQFKQIVLDAKNNKK